jgi:hypothetical protein
VVSAICLAAITRRAIASILLVAGLTLLLFLASSIKLKLLGTPLILQDAYFITGLDLAGIRLLGKYLDLQSAWTGIAAVGGLLLAALFRFEPKCCSVRSPCRWLLLLLTSGLLGSLYFAAWPWNLAWYGIAQVRPSPLGLVQGALHGGVVANLVYGHGVQRHQQFDVDVGALRAALRSVQAAPSRPGTLAGPRPDVVIMLSESFMDPRVMGGMDQVPDLIPAVRSRIAARQGGMLHVPTFGGGTVRTEFEVLTGMPVAAFPTAQYPYVDLNPGRLPGLASVLAQRGYATIAIHGNSGGFWNRSNTYEAMGIDRFLTQRDFDSRRAHRDGNWLSDQGMTDIVLDELAGARKPTLIIAISIENHGPYAMDTPVLDSRGRDAITLPGALDAAAAAELRAYSYHLHNADRQFERLDRALQARGKPYVLLFFGDHLPAFSAGSYDQLGFVDGRDAQAQLVPWVLTGNTSALSVALPADPARQLQAWELPALVLHAAGTEDAYFRFIAAAGQRIGTGSPAADTVLRDGVYAAAHARLEDRFDEFAASP